MKKYAHINFNGDFWKFVPVIYVGLSYTNSEQQINAEAATALYDLSKNLLKTLDLSKTFLPSDPEFDKFPQKFVGYNDWVKNIIQKYNYKSEIAIYRNMQSCSAIMKNGIITISPSNHCRIRSWEGMDKKFNLTILSTSPPEIIGAAVKYSITRCTGKGADLVEKKLFPDGVPETFDDYLASLNLKS